MNETLARLEAGARYVLGEQFAGLYLYGSLATGGFDPATSDIDFLVTTKGPLSGRRVDSLQEMHRALWRDGGKWAAKLEGAYVPGASLRRYDPEDGPWPGVNEGTFSIAKHDRDWVIQRHVLRECGVAVVGPSLRGLIDPVGTDELRAAVRGILASWWTSLVDEQVDKLERDDYQAFAVLTMCRALHTLHDGTVASKSVSAAWARKSIPENWRGLISEAMDWDGAQPFGRRDEAVAFVRWTLREAGVEG